MAQAPAVQPTPAQKHSLFHLPGRLAASIVKLLASVDTVIDSVDDLAQTARLHTQHIKMTTEVELSAELSDLRSQLES